ncbi:hypothetical protein [Microbispora bryophytorum]|uniref:hypothetical protein n=1 Tax=Microbispora bryophytorum TaxID=1460882 RepID=UPI0033EFACC8
MLSGAYPATASRRRSGGCGSGLCRRGVAGRVGAGRVGAGRVGEVAIGGLAGLQDLPHDNRAGRR